MTKDEVIVRLIQENKKLQKELDARDRLDEQREQKEYLNHIFRYQKKLTEEGIEYGLMTPFKVNCNPNELYELLEEYIDAEKDYCLKSFCGKMLNKVVALPNDHWLFWLNLPSHRPNYKWKSEHDEWKLFEILKVLKPYLNGSVDKTAELFFGIPDVRTTLNSYSKYSRKKAKEKAKEFANEFAGKVSERNIQIS